MTQTLALSTGQTAAILDLARLNINHHLLKGHDLEAARKITEYDLIVLMGINRSPSHTPEQAADALHKRYAVRRILAEIGA